MKWIKSTIKTSTADAEVVAAMLMGMGIYGVEIKDPSELNAFFASTSSHWDYIDESLLSQHSCAPQNSEASIIFYLGTDDESRNLLSQIQESLNSTQFAGLAIVTEVVDDQSWLHEWKKHFHPIQIGRVLIVPEWDNASHDSDIVFTIDPGSAFGTGQHATTMLCVEALQKHIALDSTVLDIGCGSGILSIISLLLGAQKVVACDIDPSAVEVTKKNAALNPINQGHLEVHAGDILSCPDLQNKIKNRSYNIVVANIVADVIIKLAPVIPNLIDPSGTFVASGIITERLEDVKSALSANNLTINEVKEMDGWCCVVAVK